MNLRMLIVFALWLASIGFVSYGMLEAAEWIRDEFPWLFSMIWKVALGGLLYTIARGMALATAEEAVSKRGEPGK